MGSNEIFPISFLKLWYFLLDNSSIKPNIPITGTIIVLNSGISVGSSVGASVGSSVGASVGSSVGASVGSSFGTSVRASVGA